MNDDLEKLKAQVKPTREWMNGAYIDVTVHAQAAFKLLAYIDALEKALHRLEQPVKEADVSDATGWKMVPVDPTLEMTRAADDYADATANRPKGMWWWGRLYQTMLAAAPAHPVVDVSDEVLTDDQIEDIWVAVSPFDGEVDMIEYARKIESAVLALRGGTPKPPMFDCVADHNPPEPL